MISLIAVVVFGLTTVACIVGTIKEWIASREVPWPFIGYTFASGCCFLFWLLI